MKTFLLHPDEDFDFDAALPANDAALTQDLELDTLFSAMAAGDALLAEVARRVVLRGAGEPRAVTYRQRVLADCIANPSVARGIYELAGDALATQRAIWGGFSRDMPTTLVRTAVQKLEVLAGFLAQLSRISAEHAGACHSEGFTRFFAMIDHELDDAYLAQIDRHLTALKFRGGTLISAGLGPGNRGRHHVLREAHEQRWLGRILDRSGYSFTIPERDDSGFRALTELQDRGLDEVANALTQAVEHVTSFLTTLRVEVGFYVACLNLHDVLAARGQATTFPEPVPRAETAFRARGLSDVGLALTVGHPVIANDVDADGRSLVVITGANQGGKSTFLRSVGLAQLMMQCGMFVGASAMRASMCESIFTHYKREEDATMRSGKLDEELARMSEIADLIEPTSLLLCNESFAATNEREGSEIARQVIRALLDAGVRVMFVTHLFDLADRLHREADDRALFLRAARAADGSRPYALGLGAPLPTSYGEDSFAKVFGRPVGPPSRGTAPTPIPTALT